MTVYRGACHCGDVRIEVDTDEPLDPYFRCNCSLCSRKGALMGQAPRRALRIVAGLDALSVYRWNTMEAAHFFCRRCGIYTHHVMRGDTDFIGINMACVEGFDVFAVTNGVVGAGAKLSLVAGPGGEHADPGKT